MGVIAVLMRPVVAPNDLQRQPAHPESPSTELLMDVTAALTRPVVAPNDLQTLKLMC